MTDADRRNPDELESAAEQELVDRLHGWHGRSEPPDGAIDRAIAHVERQRRESPRLTSAKRTKPFPELFWPVIAAAVVLVAATVRIAVTGSRSGSADAGWQPSPTIDRSTGDARPRIVRFAVALPAEVPKEVRLVGDFNGWASHGVALTRNPATGRWEGNVELPPGLHHYTYLVDGSRWMIDPGAPSAGDDLLGATNAIVVPDSR
jgi:hypothetical protein